MGRELTPSNPSGLPGDYDLRTAPLVPNRASRDTEELTKPYGTRLRIRNRACSCALLGYKVVGRSPSMGAAGIALAMLRDGWANYMIN